ncbi:MAG: FAD binding domain-containing protein [Deltaproteobacteria bacterium]|nr:FAD binding domain-containing protein [Deltaproteobacteria bacterium]
MPEVKFISVESVRQASRLIKERPPSEAILMAGGTDLLVLQKHKLIAPQSIIYLKGIAGLREIRPDGNGRFVIGAMATLDEVARHPGINQSYPMLAQAALAVASAQIRNKATLGGNICLNSRCWFYNRSPFWRSEYPECRKAAGGNKCYVVPKSRKGCFALQSGETVGPLVALDAKLRLVSDEKERLISVEEFFLADGIDYLALEPGEVLTEVLLPAAKGSGAFVKFRPQNNLDFATFTISVLPPRNGSGSRIVVGSVATRPLRARKAEMMLDQGTQNPASIARQAAEELSLVSFVRGSVEFKRQVIEARLHEILTHFEGHRSRNYEVAHAGV